MAMPYIKFMSLITTIKLQDMLQDNCAVRGIPKLRPSVKVAGPLSHPRAVCPFMCDKAGTIAHSLLMFF